MKDDVTMLRDMAIFLTAFLNVTEINLFKTLSSTKYHNNIILIITKPLQMANLSVLSLIDSLVVHSDGTDRTHKYYY